MRKNINHIIETRISNLQLNYNYAKSINTENPDFYKNNNLSGLNYDNYDNLYLLGPIILKQKIDIWESFERRIENYQLNYNAFLNKDKAKTKMLASKNPIIFSILGLLSGFFIATCFVLFRSSKI